MSASTATITIRIDANLKESAEKLFHELGLNITTAINMFMRKAVREEAIPFDVSMGQSLTDAIEDARTGHNLFGPYDNAQEAVSSMLEG
ncbi:MAG: type II toxin-antitoxin system RelB/DinJ family antitoxin [Coriobacteriales bacterium]|jgi:DNA-damage-inducible protein J|nr:type II toxin-antitoxin system RelB/DinJ family antitoxin [Coriobacteriales bacterium]